MKKNVFIALLLVLFLIPQARAQQPFGYQAIIRNTQGNPAGNQPVGIRIQIIHGSLFGNAVFVETYSTQTSEAGVVNLVIGTGSPVLGDLSEIDWSDGPYYLKVESDPTGGNTYSLTTVSEILSVPLAKYAEKSGTGFNGTFIDLENRPDVENWDQLVTDDFGGSFNDLSNKPAIPLINDPATSGTTLWSSSKTTLALSEKGESTNLYSKTNLQSTGQASLIYTNLVNKPANLDEDKTDDLLLSSDQTVNGSKFFEKNILAISGFSNFMTNLYHVGNPISSGDAVPKSYVDNLRAHVESLEALNNGMVKDYDGNLYTTVKIGDQVWMGENLKTRHSMTGESCSCAAPNNDISNVEQFGLLYLGWTISDELCPSGMKIPTDDDWKEMELYIGMGQAVVDSFFCRGTNEAIKLKINGSTGFNLLFAGRYFNDLSSSIYSGFGTDADFWCKGEITLPGNDYPSFVNRNFTSSSNKICRQTKSGIGHVYYFGSIRCVKE